MRFSLRLLLTIGCSLGGFARPARAQVAPARSDTLTAQLMQRADSAFKADRQKEALALYEAVLARDNLRSRAVFQRATLLSYQDRLPEAIAGFREYVRLEPRDDEGRIALARALAWAARYDESLAVYDSIVRRDSTYRAAVLGGAQTLAWASRFKPAIARLEDWVAKHPDDAEARLALARTLSWAGKLREAEALYRTLASEASSLDADKGLARVLGWRGALAASEEQWRILARRAPDDPEVWTGLAQVLRWAGRSPEAEEAVRRALALRPDYEDARALLPWILADVRPWLEPAILGAEDSDGNRTVLYTLAGGVTAPWLGRLLAAATYRTASVGGVDGSAATLRVGGTWTDRKNRWSGRAEVGGQRQHADRIAASDITRDVLSASARAALRVSPSAVFGVNVLRTPFDETALLIRNGVLLSSVGADADLTLPKRFSLAGGVERARLSGTPTINWRNSGAATLRWTQNRHVSYAAIGRAYGYDSTTNYGYFAPKHYTLLEGSARVELGPEIGVSGGVDAGIGLQTVQLQAQPSSSRAAERARGWLTWRPKPGYEVVATAAWASVASPGQIRAGEYSYTAFGIAGRVRLR